MFPGGNTNADLGYNKHNQYMAQPPHFLTGPPNPGTVPVPGVGNTLRTAAPVMPINMQGGIDWAQLAQQWIHMRDSTSAPPIANFSMGNMPIAPPPPIISNAPEYHQNLPASKMQTHFEEHGEAEMDMDMDEEENENNGRAIHDIKTVPPPPVATQSHWMDNSGVNDASVTVLPNDAAGSGAQTWSTWPSRGNPTAHIPSLLKLNVCNPNEHQHLMQPIQQLSQNNNNNSGGNVASSEIDANKRKMLPAWIREGLEKMEREKQRQLERQQPTSPEESETTAINVKQVSSKTLTTPDNLLNTSNVASDSEDSIAAPDDETHAAGMAQLIGNDVLSKTSGSDDELDPENDRQSQHHDAVDRDKPTVARAANAEAALSGKNYEERLADLMLVVRRTLTEILLETTNEEIAAIATETIKAHRAKASSAQVIRKSALSSITGNLGLAVYGDSSSESEEDDDTDDNDDGQVESNLDPTDKSNEYSADELKARIRKSKRAFEKVIDDIEERVSLQEQMDEQKLQHHRKLELEQTKAANEQRRSISGAESPADEIAATTSASSNYEKSQQFNGKRLSRKERTTRFSDNKDGKQSQSYVSQVAAVAAATAQSNVMPQKLKPVPNPATNLLQMPESMANMLSAADKALDKAQKTSKKSKSKRRQSSSSSSSSSSGDSSSSSSSSESNSTSNSSKSSNNTNSNSTRGSQAAKKHSSGSHRRSRGSSSRKQRSETSRDRHRKGHSSSRHSYSRHHSSRDRERDRERDRHAQHYSSQHRRRHQKRDSSNSGDENGSEYRRSSRHSSSRSHQSSSYRDSKHRDRTRSRSNSRSTHNSYSSASTRKRH